MADAFLYHNRAGATNPAHHLYASNGGSTAQASDQQAAIARLAIELQNSASSGSPLKDMGTQHLRTQAPLSDRLFVPLSGGSLEDLMVPSEPRAPSHQFGPSHPRLSSAQAPAPYHLGPFPQEGRAGLPFHPDGFPEQVPARFSYHRGQFPQQAPARLEHMGSIRQHSDPSPLSHLGRPLFYGEVPARFSYDPGQFPQEAPAGLPFYPDGFPQQTALAHEDFQYHRAPFHDRAPSAPAAPLYQLGPFHDRAPSAPAAPPYHRAPFHDRAPSAPAAPPYHLGPFHHRAPSAPAAPPYHLDPFDGRAPSAQPGLTNFASSFHDRAPSARAGSTGDASLYNSRRSSGSVQDYMWFDCSRPPSPDQRGLNNIRQSRPLDYDKTLVLPDLDLGIGSDSSTLPPHLDRDHRSFSSSMTRKDELGKFKHGRRIRPYERSSEPRYVQRERLLNQENSPEPASSTTLPGIGERLFQQDNEKWRFLRSSGLAECLRCPSHMLVLATPRDIGEHDTTLHPKEVQPYICGLGVCTEGFTNTQQRGKHVINDHKIEEAHCPFCSKEILTRRSETYYEAFRMHLFSQHHLNICWKCKSCTEMLISPSKLVNHMNSVHCEIHATTWPKTRKDYINPDTGLPWKPHYDVDRKGRTIVVAYANNQEPLHPNPVDWSTIANLTS